MTDRDRMILERAHAGEPPPEEWLRQKLTGEWPILFQLRHRWLPEIRRALAKTPGATLDAHLVFQVEKPSPSPWDRPSGRLFRDLYTDEPPAEPVDGAIGHLRRGRAADLLALLDGAPLREHEMADLWHEVSTLVGRPVGLPVIRQDGREWDCLLEAEPPAVAGGGPRLCANQPEVAARFRQALSSPPGMESHRQNALALLQGLCAGRLPDRLVDPSVAVLRHHTDLPVKLLDGRPVITGRASPQLAVAVAQLAPLEASLGHPAAFEGLLLEGLRSPSRHRRILAYRLLRGESRLPATAHFDDGYRS